MLLLFITLVRNLRNGLYANAFYIVYCCSHCFLCLVSPCFVPGVGMWHAIVSYPGNTHYHFEDNISSLINVQYLFPDHAKLIL